VNRRRFLALLGGAAGALAVGGCHDGGGGDSVAAAAPDPDLVNPDVDPPAAPELDGQTPRFVEEARAYLVAVPAALRPRARALLAPVVRAGLERGLLALSDVCPSDQIQLRWCASAAWFECPACGSQFDALGDKMGGPATAGMSVLRVTVGDDDEVAVEPRPLHPGLAAGVRLVDQPAAGPHCI
jgi:hypothetical protein